MLNLELRNRLRFNSLTFCHKATELQFNMETMYIFLFGVVLPAAVTLALFVVFLVCWFKCNLQEKCFSNKTKKSNKTDLNSSSQDGSVFSIESDSSGEQYPKGIIYPLNYQINGFGKDKKHSLDTHSVHIYDTLDYVDIVSEVSYQTANSGQRMITPHVHGKR